MHGVVPGDRRIGPVIGLGASPASRNTGPLTGLGACTSHLVLSISGDTEGTIGDTTASITDNSMRDFIGDITGTFC